MSCLLSPVSTKDDFTGISAYSISQEKHHKNILKPKENTYKHRCRRALKRKLKKYKLQHDGLEDPEVLDISQILIKTLNIKSPKSQNNKNNNSIFDENYPKNYLFKMGRRKQIVKPNENTDINRPFKCQSMDENISDTPLYDSKEKQQTNAFKLLMDSRNKSIGTNSPGKKTVDENEDQEIVEKKTNKAKRNLALQKMAEAKGSLKKKEIEEYQEECIKKKMEKRAERLKTMITSNITNTKTEKQNKKDIATKPSTIEKERMKEAKTEKQNKKDIATKPSRIEKERMKEAASDFVKHEEVSKQKTLTLINLFNDPIKNNISIEKKLVSKDDNEFLKKLSPSLKKKENMLCYFKKVDKDFPLCTDFENDDSNNDEVVIKVKLSSKLNKKVKKKKMLAQVVTNNSKSESVSIDGTIEISSDVATDNEKSDLNTNKDRRKRKRNDIIDNKVLSNNNSQDNDLLATDSRPKRNIKKPVKYTDEVEVFSSDDDLHIFTPKKKKRSDNKTPIKHNITKMGYLNNDKSDPELDKKSENVKSKSIIKAVKKTSKTQDLHKVTDIQKKNIKLAPIFALKPQLDPAAIEAKQKFLQSGVPEKLKKMIVNQNIKNLKHCVFPTTVHIQQNEKLTFDVHTPIPWNNPSEDISDNELFIPTKDNLFKNILNSLLDKRTLGNGITNNYNKFTILQNIKKMYPKFPVYRTYRLLKDKKCGELKECSYQDLDNSVEVINEMNDLINENPDKLNWTDKYKATSSKHIIGNFDSIKELRKWLITWTENEVNSRNRLNIESDSSDFYHSDTDSKESFKSNNNLLMITGPVGSGKTSCVYAVAAELAIKVIEVNASSKRTGKIMLQDLQEATQSHKVNRGKSNAENSQKSQETPEVPTKTFKKKGRPKKHTEKSSKNTVDVVKIETLSQNQPANSQESARTEMSLILIDDADIVFEQDDGFCSAIVQLVQSSKRPVILISSSTSCTHLQRFSQSAKMITMRPLLPRMLGTWLDLMCLADGGVCIPGTGAIILDFFKGDIRRAINSLQFYVSSQIQTENEESNTHNSDPVPYADDENSSMSWADRDNTEDKQTLDENSETILCKYIIGHQLTMSQYHRPLYLFNMWWSIPKFLISPFNSEMVNGHNIGKQENNQNGVVAMDAIANALDSVSVAEYYRPTKSAASLDITSNPWFSLECDSVSENDHSYDYDSNQETLEEISHKLVSGSILEAQNILKVEQNTDMQFPSMAMRRQRDQIVSRHHNLSSCLNPSSALDRKALALDYWSYCRTICRLEKSKTDNNFKRNNRFCHYLKSLNVMCKTDYFDKLADSLDSSSKPE